ncbi:MAG: hypothetical protein KatS3mg010_1402 [Acidimicrobiia bacterium]|nr:MAG: hypothetical protein KatS3mg010_1402 [Acidimicrobiia bacterium]
MIGPRQGVPCATVTHTFPRSLHSTHTLWAGTSGARPLRNALITSSSCRPSIGQPRSSKSTGTCAAIGVEVSSVSMYDGVGVHDAAVLLDVGEVAQCLDAAGRGARADGHEPPGDGAHGADPLGVGGRA